MDWKDITRHSRGEEKVLRVWEVCLGQFRLRVHRHIHFPQTQWLATCHGVFQHFELTSEKIEEAKCQAVVKLQMELEKALHDIMQMPQQKEDGICYKYTKDDWRHLYEYSSGSPQTD